MISVTERNQDYLRFLWIDSIDKEEPEIQDLRFARVIFGVTWSPFLLNATIRYHLDSNSDKFPSGQIAEIDVCTVDDVIMSAKTEEEACIQVVCKV